MTVLPAPAIALLQAIPAKYRKTVFGVVGILSSLATLVVLALPHAHDFGITVPSRWGAIATTVAAVLSLVAHANVPIDTEAVPPADSGDGLS